MKKKQQPPCGSDIFSTFYVAKQEYENSKQLNIPIIPPKQNQQLWQTCATDTIYKSKGNFFKLRR